MAIKCQVVMDAMEKLAPRQLCEEWDNVGLLLGSPAQDVEKIRVCLDVSPEVAEQAVADKIDLLVAHHPLIFGGMKQIRTDLPAGRNIARLIQGNIAVYAAHTNLDVACGGVNDVLADCLKLQNVTVLAANFIEKMIKLAVYVPQTHADQVRRAMAHAGAGHIGNYSHCTFQTGGIGTFLPQEGTHPFIGKQGKLESVEEYRIETIMPEKISQRVLRAVLRVHPYEEPAYDIYPLQNAGSRLGLGRIGVLSEAVSLIDFASFVRESLGVAHVRIVGAEDRMVRKAAVCGGAGASLIHKAAFAGADVLVTGDVKYHEAQEAVAAGIAVIDAGHFATERPVCRRVAEYLHRSLTTETKCTVQVDVDNRSGDIFRVT